jgi:hypothetical protein
MNILGLIFSILMILSYSYYACVDKQNSNLRLCNTYKAFQEANRKISNDYETAFYQTFQGKAKETSQEKKGRVQKKPAQEKKKPAKPNRECARINLWPLINEGKENHPLLYELTAKLIRNFYPTLYPKQTQFEYRFLDAFLTAAKSSKPENGSLAFEKIDLMDPELQKIYYKMLKGTKEGNKKAKIKYHSFLEYVKADSSEKKLCLCHADPDLLSILFNPKTGSALYEKMHQKPPSALTKELVENLSLGILNPNLLELLEFGYHRHSDAKKVFVAEGGKEGDVSLKRKLSLDHRTL